MIKFGIFIDPEKVFDYVVSPEERMGDSSLRYEKAVSYSLGFSDHKKHGRLKVWYRKLSPLRAFNLISSTRNLAQEFADNSGISWDWDFCVRIPFSGGKYKVIKRTVFHQSAYKTTNWDWITEWIEENEKYKEEKPDIFELLIIFYDFFEEKTHRRKIYKREG